MIRGMLNSRASITRYTVDMDSGPDPDETAVTIASDVPCRLTVRSGKETVENAEITEAKTTIFFEYGTDILEKDEVVIDSLKYLVHLVNPDPGGARSHVEVEALQVR